MEKIGTNIEQSKKLIELGIDVNTADMRYGYNAPYEYSDRMFDGGYDEVPYPKDFLKRNPNFSENDYDGELPAWSLSALLELIPSVISLSNHEGKYNIRYANEFIIDQKLHDSYIDACYEVVVWLKENNKL